MFHLLAAGFLAFTTLMVLFVLFLGYLQWREDRADEAAPEQVAPVVAKPVA
jgi:hypothetical protein